MSILERLARLARAEYNEIKSVMSDRDDASGDGSGDSSRAERARRQRELDAAREELARAEENLQRATEGAGADSWGRGDEGGRGETTPINQTQNPAAADDGTGAAGARAWGAPRSASKQQNKASSADGRGGRTVAIGRDVRQAYAALELPLGSDKAQVGAAHRRLLGRYHPDKHVNNPQLAATATTLTRELNGARDLLLRYLSSVEG